MEPCDHERSVPPRDTCVSGWGGDTQVSSTSSQFFRHVCLARLMPRCVRAEDPMTTSPERAAAEAWAMPVSDGWRRRYPRVHRRHRPRDCPEAERCRRRCGVVDVWLRDLPPLCRDCAESDRAGRHPDHPHCGAAFHRAPGRRSPGSWPRGYRWARMSASLTTRRCRPRSCETRYTTSCRYGPRVRSCHSLTSTGRGCKARLASGDERHGEL